MSTLLILPTKCANGCAKVDNESSRARELALCYLRSEFVVDRLINDDLTLVIAEFKFCRRTFISAHLTPVRSASIFPPGARANWA